ncbi:MAG: IS200/IS605 family element transposase accessory protein TnpB [Candidatus Omnitrophica bacterium]|nr:IS200/IS605 family element transposase accessory protein TnpB [Candidatus Omnitrophota bacterium]
MKLIRNYGLIAVECLGVHRMLKNHRLARAISDVAWSSFMNILKSKAESAGIPVVEVESGGTSQVCSACGCVVEKMLSVRWHHCHRCGFSIHRDHNAALNILGRALQARTVPVGA